MDMNGVPHGTILPMPIGAGMPIGLDPAVAAAAAAAAALNDQVIAENKKRRRTTSTDGAKAFDVSDHDNAAAVAAAVADAAQFANATDVGNVVLHQHHDQPTLIPHHHQHQQFTADHDDDESMQDVMAKMKEIADANAAAQFPLATPSSPSQSPSQSHSIDTRDDDVVECKRMGRVSFNSWFEFDAYFELYMQETFQPFRMRSSCSVDAYRRNQQKVMMTNKNSRGRRIEFPDAAIHHHRIYMCTHAMKARFRGAAKRPGQVYRGMGCVAKINVKISPSDNANKYMVIVTDQVVTHNHSISREDYEKYPDVLLKTMRRNQLGVSMQARQPTPKFETPGQTHKYERTLALLTPLAEAMAQLPDDEFEAQFSELHKVYMNTATEQNTV